MSGNPSDQATARNQKKMIDELKVIAAAGGGGGGGGDASAANQVLEIAALTNISNNTGALTDISNNQATAANQVLEIAALTNISNNTGALTDISNNQASEIAALTDISNNTGALTDISNNQASEIAALTDISNNTGALTDISNNTGALTDISNNTGALTDISNNTGALTDISNNTGALIDISNNQASEIAALTDISNNTGALTDISNNTGALTDISNNTGALTDISNNTGALIDISNNTGALIDISNNQASEIAALTDISNNTGALTDISNNTGYGKVIGHGTQADALRVTVANDSDAVTNQLTTISKLTDISSNQQAVIARLDGTTGSKILDMNLNLVDIVNKLVDGNNMKLIRKNQEGKCFCAQRPWATVSAGVFSPMLSIVNPASSTKNLYFYSYSSTAYLTGYFEALYIISGTPTSGTDVSCNILNSSNDVSGNTSVAVAKANPTYTLGSDDYIVDIENAKDDGTSSVNAGFNDRIIIEAGKGIFVRVRPIAGNEYSCLFKWYEE